MREIQKMKARIVFRSWRENLTETRIQMCPRIYSGVTPEYFCYGHYRYICIYCSLPVVVTLTYRALHVKTALLLFRHDSLYSEVGSSNRGWILLAFPNVYAMISSMGISPVFRQKLCATVEYIYSRSSFVFLLGLKWIARGQTDR